MLRLTKHTSSNFMCRALFPPVVSSECSKLQRWAITDRRMCHEARTLSKTEGPNTHPPHPPWRTNNAVASHPTDVWFGTSIRLPILLGSTPIGWSSLGILQSDVSSHNCYKLQLTKGISYTEISKFPRTFIFVDLKNVAWSKVLGLAPNS
jgi:hypothetical protein